MDRIIYTRILPVLLACAALLVFASCGESETETSSSGNITMAFSSPGQEPGDHGYLSYSGTLTVEDGNMTLYELTGVRLMKVSEVIRAQELTGYMGMRYRITRTVSRDAEGIFAGIAEGTREVQTFYLDSADDPIPLFDPESRSYEKGKGVFEWDGDRLISFTGYGPEGEAWVAGNKDVYEYYENGTLKSIRKGDWEHESLYFSEAEYYGEYDPVFALFPFLTAKFHAEYSIDESIPDGYNYDDNPSQYPEEPGTRYLYTADPEGGIGTIIQQKYDDAGWEDDIKIEAVYDSSGNIATLKLYLTHDWPEEPHIQIDFTIPSGMSITFGDLFFPPWKEVIVPFFED